jgi:hypothetical protein
MKASQSLIHFTTGGLPLMKAAYKLAVYKCSEFQNYGSYDIS